MLISIAALIFADPSAVLSSMITGANGAVSLALTLVALYGIWLGLFEVLDGTGIADKLARLLRPVVRRLFKGESAETEKYVSMNISANLLGLGNAATPMGIGAVGSMKRGRNKAIATTNMIMLVVISATSLQIFPSTVISMRAAAGSANPADFLLPCIAATVTSTIVGIIGVKLLGRLLEKREAKKDRKRATKTYLSTDLSETAPTDVTLNVAGKANDRKNDFMLNCDPLTSKALNGHAPNESVSRGSGETEKSL